MTLDPTAIANLPMVREAMERARRIKGGDLDPLEREHVIGAHIDLEAKQAKAERLAQERAPAELAVRAVVEPAKRADLLAKARASLICAADVDAPPTEWLWHRRIPIGELTILESDAGVGKSTVWTDLAARTSTGRPMPGEDTGREPGSVLWIGEEPPGRVKARFALAGGDVRRLYILPELALPDQALDLQAAAESIGDARLVVLDTIEDCLGPEVNPWRGPDVRTALRPLEDLARQLKLSVGCTRHLRKSGGTAIHRGTGSVAFTAKARSVLSLIRRDGDAETIYMPAVKHSLCRRPDTLTLSLREAPHTEDLATVHWIGEDPRTADELLAPPPGARGPDPVARDDCGAWIVDALSGGEAWADDLESDALAAGFSKRTFQRARAELGQAGTIRKLRRETTRGIRYAWIATPPNT